MVFLVILSIAKKTIYKQLNKDNLHIYIYELGAILPNKIQ